MAFENTSTRTLIAIFGAIIAGAAVFLVVFVFPASNLIRDTVIMEGVVVSNANNQCVIDTPDRIPKLVKNCDLARGSKVTVSFQEGMEGAKIVSEP